MKPMILLVAAMALTAGCAAVPPESLPADHPANPNAPASPPAAMSNTLGLPDDPGHEAAAAPEPHPATGPVVHVCPMHPKVVSTMPGDCPECGMQLRPKGGRP